MSTLGSGTPSPATEDTSKHWVPHGPVLTSCVVGVNVLMILLIFFFLWRFFSGKPKPSASSAGAAADDDDASSSASLPVASPWATHWRRGDQAGGAQRLDADVASALPVYVYTSAGGAATESECAVCIVELCDGESARRLPRCGHQFHAGCVGEWLRLHDTCPLCRASVVAPAAVADLSRNAKDDDDVAADCPV